MKERERKKNLREQQGLDERRHVGRVRGLNSRCSSPLHLTPSETRSRNATEDHGQVYGGGGDVSQIEE